MQFLSLEPVKHNKIDTKDRLDMVNIFDNVDLGIVMLDYERKEVVYSNNYFKLLTGSNAWEVLDHIWNCLEFKRKCSFREIETTAGISIGYSAYQVSEFDYLILVNDISNRKIFLETKGDNHYYDKLSNFTAEIAHEIGNPLTSVIITLQVLLKNISGWNEKEKGEYIGKSIDELKRLSRFLKKIRDLTKEDIIEKKKVPLKPVLERLFLQNKAILESANVSYRNDVPDDVEVVIDEDAFYQVLFNLLQNSLDCLTETDKKGVIDVGIEGVGDFFVKLTFKNNGPPICPDILEKIFMPFFSTKEDGRGLGLNISRKLMTRMGGTIRAEVPGDDDWGAGFVLYIPNEEQNG